ncbi:MAG: DUF6261 family protein [Bacteroidales bacterium]|jgi:hypothetical protein|nr:DUF6261 family protein [Bacteroidales bacterium]
MNTNLRIHSRSSISDISYALGSILIAIKDYFVTSDQYLKIVREKLSSDYNLLIEIINESKKKSALISKDKLRDRAIRVIFHIVKGVTYLSDEKDRGNAMLINGVLDKYTLDITNYTYSKQTVALDALIRDLESEEIKNAIDESFDFLKKYIDNLKQTVAEWKDELKNTFDQEIEKNNNVSAYELHIKLRNTINRELLMYIEAMSMANPDMYSDLEKILRTIVKDTNNRIRKNTQN